MKSVLFKQFIITLFLFVVLGEICIRMLGDYDENRNFWVGDRCLRPYKIPINTTKRLLGYYERGYAPFVRFDSLTGWRLTPGFVSEDSMYKHNLYGIRDLQNLRLDKDSGVIRIGLFGDSYIYGDEVVIEETLPYLLEEKLARKKVEVINFGVGGFGMDQAYLHYKNFGKNYNLDYVIFGFQPENMMRNLNIFRIMYNLRDKVPFSKPRFIEDKGFKLVNYPTLPVHAIIDTLEQFSSTNIKEKETFYTDFDFHSPFYFNSRLISYIFDVFTYNRFTIGKQEAKHFAVSSPTVDLSLQIVQKFRADVVSDSSQFICILIPRKEDLQSYLKAKDYIFKDVINTIKKEGVFIDPTSILLKSASQHGLMAHFKPNGHYSGIAHNTVANSLAEYFETKLP